MNINLMFLFGNLGGVNMNSILLPPMVDLESYANKNEIINNLYELYKSDLMEKENRVRLFDKFIYIECKWWIDYKAEMFWHLISLSEDNYFKELPCDDNIKLMCEENCINHIKQITLNNGQVRDICYFRAARIIWIKEIIKLANNNNSHIKKWEKEGILYIRFEHETADYILLFLDKLNNGRYYFISAFPVFYPDSKVNYDKDFRNYQKNKNR